jgi:hypothetical protein
MQTIRITTVDRHLMQFIEKCEQNQFMNNKSLVAMKWNWCMEEDGAWFATYTDDFNEIISLSGIHPFEDGYRVLFRGAQLQVRPCGLNRYHMQSYCFADQLPMQIDFAKDKPLYITTNVEHDASGRMNKVDKLFHTLEKLGVVHFVEQKEVWYTKQNIWQLDVEKYKSIRL